MFLKKIVLCNLGNMPFSSFFLFCGRAYWKFSDNFCDLYLFLWHPALLTMWDLHDIQRQTLVANPSVLLPCVQVFHSLFWPLEFTVPGRDNNKSYAKVICNKLNRVREHVLCEVTVRADLNTVDVLQNLLYTYNTSNKHTHLVLLRIKWLGSTTWVLMRGRWHRASV